MEVHRAPGAADVHDPAAATDGAEHDGTHHDHRTGDVHRALHDTYP